MIVERDCKMCGTHFRRSISRNRKNLVAFCSRVCKDMGNAEKLRKVGVATFWDKIERGDGCWLWPHYRDSDGYGVIFVGGKLKKAHRIAYELTSGQIPAGLVVCHRCDNPSCVRPDHLFLGTRKDNGADAAAKGRMPRGEHHVFAKLRATDIPAIRADQRPAAQIARDYGVAHTTITGIKKRRDWKHIP